MDNGCDTVGSIIIKMFAIKRSGPPAPPPKKRDVNAKQVSVKKF